MIDIKEIKHGMKVIAKTKHGRAKGIISINEVVRSVPRDWIRYVPVKLLNKANRYSSTVYYLRPENVTIEKNIDELIAKCQ